MAYWLTHEEPTEFSFQEAKTIIDYLETLGIDATLEEIKDLCES